MWDSSHGALGAGDAEGCAGGRGVSAHALVPHAIVIDIANIRIRIFSLRARVSAAE